MPMPMERSAARNEFKRILRDVNKSFNDVYDVEREIAMLILKYCDREVLKKRLRGLMEID